MFFSLDSAVPQIHDRLRGVEGCFEKAVHGMCLSKAAGIMTAIWTYVSRSHYEELGGIAALAKHLDIDGVYTFQPLLSGHFFNRPDENLTPEEREMFRKKFKHLQNVTFEFTSEKDVCAGGGNWHICVMPSGDVTFCPPVPYSYGNISSKSLKECLKDIRKDYKRFCLGPCRGQCIVNFPQYRKNCNAKFIYE